MFVITFVVTNNLLRSTLLSLIAVPSSVSVL